MSTFGKVASLGGSSDRIDQARAKALMGGDEWDNQIADYTAQFLPAGTKIEYSKHPNKVTAVSAAFAEDDPRREMAPMIKGTFQRLLTRPEFEGVDPQQLLPVLAQAYTEVSAPDVHEYTRRAESSLLGFGGKEVVRAPGYEQWLEQKKQQEAAQEASDDAQYNIGQKIATWAGLGAGISLATMAGKKAFAKATGRAVMAIPHPVAKVAGAALLAIPEFAAFEKVAEWIGESEWGRANQQEGKLDRVDVLEMLAGTAAGVGINKAVMGGIKGYTARKAAEQARIAGLPGLEPITAERGLVPYSGVMRPAGSVVDVEATVVPKTLGSVGQKALPEETAVAGGGFGAKGVEEGADLGKLREQYKQHLEVLVGLGTEYEAARAAAMSSPTAQNILRLKTAKDALKKHTDGKFMPLVEQLRKGELEKGGGISEQWLTGVGKKADDADVVFNPEVLPEGVVSRTTPLATAEQVAKAGEEIAPIISQPRNAKGWFVSRRQPVLDSESFPAQAAEIAELRALQAAEPNGVKAAEIGAQAEKKAAELVKQGEQKLAALDDVGAAEVAQRTAAGQAPAEALEAAGKAMEARRALVPDAKKQKAAVDAFVQKQNEVLRKRAEGATKLLKELEAKQLKTSEQLVAENQAKGLAETEAISAESVGAERLVSKEPLVAQKELNVTDLQKSGPLPTKQVIKFSAENPPPIALVQQGKMTPSEYWQQPAELLKAEYDQFNQRGLGDQLAKQRRLLQQSARDEKAEQLIAQRAERAKARAQSGQKDFIGEPTESVAADMAETLEKAGGGEKGLNAAKLAMILSPAAVALGTLFAPFSPSEAEAGVLDNFFKQAFNVADDAVAAQLKKDLVESVPVHRAGSTELAPKMETINVQAGVTDETGKYIGSTEAVKGTQRTPSALRALQNIVSPHNAAQFFYNKIGNPSVVLAHKVQGMLTDISNGFAFLDDVYRGVPGMEVAARQAAFKEVRQVMKPLAERYNKVWLPVSMRESRIAQLTEAIKRTEGKIAKNTDPEKVEVLKGLNAKRAEAIRVEKEKLGGLLKEKEAFGVEYQQAMKHLAGKHTSTRIALAAEDTVEFAKYPWLKEMMSETELGAVAQVKKMMREYGVRMEKVGGRKIEGDYVHHALHPDINPAELKKVTDEVMGDNPFGLAFTKFHHRAQSSLQMMPELSYVMEKYLPDVNRRIMLRDFWKPGSKTGWDWHSTRSPEVMSSKALQQYWRNFRDALEPREVDWADNAARYYSSFEALRLLALMPSTAAKHAVKITADFAQRPLAMNLAALPKSMKAAAKLTLREMFPEKMGRAIKLTEEEAFLEAMTRQQHVMESISDMGLGDLPGQAAGMLSKNLDKLNRYGGSMIRLVEMFDRSHNILSGLQMAGKQGMTPHQAKFAIMSSILNNNFLGGVQNPAWLNNPKIRALLMFQGTPFKIAERRAQTLLATGQNIKGGVEEFVRQLKNLRADMQEGERAFKSELIWEALHKEKDLYGTSMTTQAMKELLAVGAIIGVGKEALNMDFWDYTLHLPFLKSGKDDPTLALNPAISSIYSTNADREEGDEDLWIADFFKDYFRNQGPLPSIVTKVARLSKDDIPEVYRNSEFPQFSYMFAVPGIKD